MQARRTLERPAVRPVAVMDGTDGQKPQQKVCKLRLHVALLRHSARKERKTPLKARSEKGVGNVCHCFADAAIAGEWTFRHSALFVAMLCQDGLDL